MKALDNLYVKIKMDGMIVAVAHDEFGMMKLDEIKKFMNDKPVLVDVLGRYKAKDTMEKGFYYRGCKLG
ncbi:hypothetical protein C5S29_07465 [ANME-1 cluster archaeon GoMg3.2]|nr:hypothetical protein [ANME-1 cluster archaeon GoMg3.2]